MSGNEYFGYEIPDSVVDNYEDGDLSEYDQTGEWGITTSNVIEGQYAIDHLTGGDDWQNPLVSYSGLPDYPEQGDVIACLMRDIDAGGAIFGWGAGGSQSSLDAFGVRLHTGDELSIVKWSNGSISELNLSSPTIDNTTWYDVEVWWHDGSGSEPAGTLEVFAYEVNTGDLTRGSQVGTVSTTDTDYASNTGIAFGRWSGNGSAGTISDAVRVMGSVADYSNPDGVII